MPIRINGNRVGFLGLIFLGFCFLFEVGFFGWLDRKDAEKKLQQQKEEEEVKLDVEKTNNELTALINSINIRHIGSIEYSIIGPNTIRMIEGDVSYRFNYAAKIVSLRNTFENAERTGQFSVISFYNLQNPEYIEELKKIVCQSIISQQNAIMKNVDFSKYSKEGQSRINTTYSDVMAFGETYCH